MNKKINKLATEILENIGVYREYTDEDLANTVLILQEVFMAKMYQYHKDKLTLKQLGKLATEAGKSLRQTILLFTGVDLHKVYKE
ncbi:MAG: hypothetical protein GWP19_01780 [Planctomycetia bacterium]|nr:hypothetical protein [Planctomycetia bacterium]